MMKFYSEEATVVVILRDIPHARVCDKTKTESDFYKKKIYVFIKTEE